MKKCLLLILVLLAKVASGQNAPDFDNTIPGNTTLAPLPSPFTNNTSLIYERVFTPQSYITDPNAIDENTSPLVNKMSTTYFDKSGRKIQSIIRYGGTSNSDIVQLFDNRQGTQNISYLPYATGGNSKFKLSPYTEQRNYYLTKYPEEEGTSYSMTQYEYGSTDNNRQIKTLPPGKTTVGQNRGVTNSSALNTANEVIKWGFDFTTRLPINQGYYAVGELHKEITVNSDGGRSEDFKDRLGKLVCSKRWAGTISNPVVQTSYKIYDDLGREIFYITPKGTDAIVNNTATLATVANNLCNYTEYDNNGRVFKNHTASEEGYRYSIYDRKGRLVLSQSPNQFATQKLSFVQYDKLDRVIRKGIFSNTGNVSIASIQGWLDNSSITNSALNGASSLLYFFAYNAQEGLWSTSVNDAEIYEEYYYDDYSNPLLSSRSFNGGMYFGNFATDNTSYLPGSYLSMNTYGRLTGKKIKVFNQSGSSYQNELVEVYFYDTYDRLIQTQAKNIFGGWDYSSNQYNYSGDILRNVVYHNNPGSSSKPYTTVVTANYYSPITFLLSSVKTKVDNGDWRTLATYSYNELGNVIEKNIGQIEKQAFSYNIRGKLTGINKQYAESGTPTTQVTFGESLRYDHGFTNSRYDGNVTGILWKGANSMPIRAYGYQYDLCGRLIGADFNEQKQTVQWNNGIPMTLLSWSKQTTDFSVDNLNYDLNGNITSMDVRGMINGSPTEIDKLSYDYNISGPSNRLNAVNDAVTTPFIGNDFKDGNQTILDYEYDANGNLTKDANKKIESIAYNELDQPTAITFSSSVNGSIKYTYDAEGRKIAEDITDGSTLKNLTYVGPFIYDGANLLYILNGEGRVRYHYNSSNVKVCDYDYFVKDHLDNIRTVVTAEEVDTKDYLATHELASANVEEELFTGIDEVREGKPESVNPNDLNAAELNGAIPDKRIGTSLLLKVMAGDQFELKTDGYFEDYSQENDDPVSNSNMLESLVSALSGGISGLEGWEGAGSGQQLVNKLFTPDVYNEAYSAIVANATDPSKPKAYINYVVFDEEMHIVPEESGAIQVGEAGAWQTIQTAGKLTIGRNGYLAVYISNSSKNSVYFDNVKIKFYKGALLEENHYYPYGLVINDGTTNPLGRKYLYQGKEFREELGLCWYDFHARQYDPQIGRFLSLDPAGQFNSGYIGMGNNPVSFTDPSGEVVHIAAAAIIGAVVNLAVNAAQGNVKTAWGAVGYLVTGAVSGAAFVTVGPVVSGSIMGFGNSITTQAQQPSGKIDWGQVAVSTVVGGVVGGIGNVMGNAITPALSGIASAPLKNIIGSTITGGLLGFGMGTVSSLAAGKSLGEAFHDGLIGAGWGAGSALFASVLGEAFAASQSQVNPNTGESETLNAGDLEPPPSISDAEALSAAQSQVRVIDEEFAAPLTFTIESEVNIQVIQEGGVNSSQVTINPEVHGNSLQSTKPTWGYKLYSKDGTFLKNGITSKPVPETRYSRSFMNGKVMQEKILFPTRRDAYNWEYQQNVIFRGPLNRNMH